MKVRSTYAESLMLTEGNHIAAAIMQLAEEFYIELPAIAEELREMRMVFEKHLIELDEQELS